MNSLLKTRGLFVIITVVLLLLLTLSAFPRAAVGQSSTVFVLETSDLESPPEDESPPAVSTKRSPPERDQKMETIKITDDGRSSASEEAVELSHSNNKKQSTHTHQNNSHNNNSINNSHNDSNNHNKHSTMSSSHTSSSSSSASAAAPTSSSYEKTDSNPQREPKHSGLGQSHTHSATRSILSAASGGSHNHNSEPPSLKLRTTRSPTGGDHQDYISSIQQPPAETEKRLLISISNNDQDDVDEPGLKPPKRETLSTGSISPGHGPSITISIQDSNRRPIIDGQAVPIGGDKGTVILRPTDKGFEITTSNGAKPPLINLSSGPGSLVSNGGNGLPYREPVNQPNIIRPSHTTHRPSSNVGSNSHNNNHNDDYAGSDNKPRPPPISTLLEQPISSRPPFIGSSTYERPQRPVVSLDDSLVEPQQPGSRPINFVPSSVRPHLDPISSSSDTSGPVNPPSQQHSQNHNQQQQQHQHEHEHEHRPSKYPLNEKNCGIMQETKIVGGEEANPDDFLWMAAIVKARPREGEAKPFCGGSLITRRHVLTAAHCLENIAPRDVLVRLGSYDFDDASASSTSGDYAVDQFRVPANYSKKTHAADIAIMRLKDPIAPTDNYKTLCMPIPRRSYVGALGTVTGYGSQSQQVRQASPKLRQVTVPIWENRKCSLVYKRNLTESFLCAGYEEGGRDACQGDSGGPLMTEGPNQKLMLVGVVSHGIGCGAPGYPGVYTRTTSFLDWVEKNTRE